MPPLTLLSEDERLLFGTVLEFARREIGPHTREMDEQAIFPKDLIPKLFELGVMGIEVPEDLGGGGATFLDRKSTRLNSSHIQKSRMPSSA